MNALGALHERSLSTGSPSERPRMEASIDSAPVAASPMAPRPAHASVATPPSPSLFPPRLVIELDQAAERFVQTLVDNAGDTVLRRYPDEAQLAFSRGVNAYMAAIARR